MEVIESNEQEAAETQPEQLLESPNEVHVSRTAAASRTLNEDEVVTHRVTPPFFRIIAWIIGVVILAILIILFARWFYHKVHHNTETTAGTTSTLSTSSSSATKQPGQSSQSTNSTSTNPANPTPSSTNQNNNLPNSGPGQTLAIFAGVSLATAGIHYIIADRRAKQS